MFHDVLKILYPSNINEHNYERLIQFYNYSNTIIKQHLKYGFTLEFDGGNIIHTCFNFSPMQQPNQKHSHSIQFSIYYHAIRF